MGIYKNSPYFQLVKRYSQTPISTLVFLLIFLLIPIRPFNNATPHWITAFEVDDPQDLNEKLSIYSIVKFHGPNMSEAEVWAISDTILRQSKKYSVDPLLVLAVIKVESRFQPEAASSEGAKGLMQIRSIAANAIVHELGSVASTGDFPPPSAIYPLNLEDPIVNIKLGVLYLHHLKGTFRDIKLALSAYNLGPTRVKTHLEREEKIPLGYAMKVLSAYHTYRKNIRPFKKTTQG